jgi:hypothetical protein
VTFEGVRIARDCDHCATIEENELRGQQIEVDQFEQLVLSFKVQYQKSVSVNWV